MSANCWSLKGIAFMEIHGCTLTNKNIKFAWGSGPGWMALEID